MKISFSGSIIAISALLFACNNPQNHSQHDANDQDTVSASQHASSSETDLNIPTTVHSFKTVDAGVTADLQQAFQHYVHIGSALANDDAKEAVSGANSMLTAMQKLNTNNLAADQKLALEKEQKTVLTSISNIAAAAQDIDAQRNAFEALSSSMYALAKDFGAHTKLYKTFCPMAFNNKGAYWLSTGTEIKNPYFGASMLGCGEVQEAIQ